MFKYLNTKKAYENFIQLLKGKYFVDKSNIIEKLNEVIETQEKYICITRPRRFGKSCIINMLGTYYTKGIDSKNIFDKLNISKSESYLEHLNKHNVINIDFSEMPSGKPSFSDYLGMIENTIKEDIYSLFPSLKKNEYKNISRLLEESGEKYIFILDEWDFIFNRGFFKENQEDFLDFLRGLLKDKPYVSLAYMTGILPIKKHSTASTLNMFEEFTFLKDRQFGEYFGFTEEETKELCRRNSNIAYSEIEKWYNGYMTVTGIKVLNPRSVVLALKNSNCESYWTNTGAMDEVLHYIKYNILDLREDIIKMVNGESVRATIKEEFRAGQEKPSTRVEIYSAMIILGFLSYYEGRVKIPNNELLLEYEKALYDESFGAVSEIVKASEELLDATINREEEKVAQMVHEVHNLEAPILKYNDENSLSSVITLAYLSARDRYDVIRESKEGKGYADFAFYPKFSYETPFILELKKNDTPENAIKQIRENEYAMKMKKKYKDREILLVGIVYDFEKKEHSCKIEAL